jgi:hypothetical protein
LAKPRFIRLRPYEILGVRGTPTDTNIHESTSKLLLSSLNGRCTAILYIKYEYEITHNDDFGYGAL